MGKHPCEGCVDAVKDINEVDGYRCGYSEHNRRSRLKICPPREKEEMDAHILSGVQILRSLKSQG
jgi:hypothetical protein